MTFTLTLAVARDTFNFPSDGKKASEVVPMRKCYRMHTHHLSLSRSSLSINQHVQHKRSHSKRTFRLILSQTPLEINLHC